MPDFSPRDFAIFSDSLEAKVLADAFNLLAARIATLETDLATAETSLGTLETDVATLESDVTDLEAGEATATANFVTIETWADTLIAKMNLDAGITDTDYAGLTY